jgi:hypothetical protein
MTADKHRFGCSPFHLIILIYKKVSGNPVNDHDTSQRSAMKKNRKRWPLVTVSFALIAAACLFQSVSVLFLLPEDTSSFGLVEQKKGSVLLFVHAPPTSEPLPPQQVLKDYQQWHSRQALEQNSQGRKFQVVYYSCPQAAGNLLHDVFNQVLVAVALNRTMLWKYNDPQTCNATRKGFGGLVCLKANTEADCARSLQRADWLPTWDEWAPKLLDNTTHLPVRNPKVHTLSDWQDAPAIAHKPMVYQTKLAQWNSRQMPFLTTNNSSQYILQQLYASGVDFLFGLLFLELLPFQPTIYPPEYASMSTPLHHRQRVGKTYAIHSRHFTSTDDGSVIRHESQCLRELLRKDDAMPCTVYIL